MITPAVSVPRERLEAVVADKIGEPFLTHLRSNLEPLGSLQIVGLTTFDMPQRAGVVMVAMGVLATAPNGIVLITDHRTLAAFREAIKSSFALAPMPDSHTLRLLCDLVVMVTQGTADPNLVKGAT